MEEKSLPIKDIKEIAKEFENLKKRLDLLDEGFRAAGSDYLHHIEISKVNKHEIFELKDNVMYRYFSARFHLQILIQHHQVILKRFAKILETDPSKILNKVYPVNPNFDYAEKEISSVLDSIYFHIGAVFDYLSILVNYVCGPKATRSQKIKWTQLTRSCRDKDNHFGQLEIAKVVDQIDRELVNKLFEYRSDLIHKSQDQQRMSFKINFKKNGANLKLDFLATSKITKQFPELKEEAKNNSLTVNYVAFWTLHKSIDMIAKLLLSLKSEMEKRSTFPDHIGDDDLIILHVDKKTNVGLPASTPMWERFNKEIWNKS